MTWTSPTHVRPTVAPPASFRPIQADVVKVASQSPSRAPANRTSAREGFAMRRSHVCAKQGGPATVSLAADAAVPLARLPAPQRSGVVGFGGLAKKREMQTLAQVPAEGQLRPPYLLDLNAIVDPRKVRTLDGSGRDAYVAARKLYNSDFAFLDMKRKRQVVDTLAQVARDETGREALRRFHLPRTTFGHPIRYSVEMESHSGQILRDYMPTAAVPPSKAPSLSYSEAEWDKLTDGEREAIMTEFCTRLEDYREKQHRCLVRRPGSSVPAHFVDVLDVETNNVFEIKTAKYYESLDQLYSALDFLNARYGEGDTQVHVTFGEAGRDPKLARDLASLIYLLNIAAFVSQAGRWQDAFAHPWLQAPRRDDMEAMAWTFAHGGHFDATRWERSYPFKHTCVAPRDRCYGSSEGDKPNPTKGVEIRRPCDWSLDPDAPLPEHLRYGKMAELMSDVLVAGGLTAEASRELAALPLPAQPFSRDASPEEQLGARERDIVRMLTREARRNTVAHGLERPKGFSETSVLFGPWYGWEELPFVPDATAEHIRSRARDCVDKLHSIVEEANHTNRRQALDVGSRLNHELLTFLHAVYEGSDTVPGLRTGLVCYLERLGVAARAAVTEGNQKN